MTLTTAPRFFFRSVSSLPSFSLLPPPPPLPSFPPLSSPLFRPTLHRFFGALMAGRLMDLLIAPFFFFCLCECVWLVYLPFPFPSKNQLPFFFCLCVNHPLFPPLHLSLSHFSQLSLPPVHNLPFHLLSTASHLFSTILFCFLSRLRLRYCNCNCYCNRNRNHRLHHHRVFINVL